MMRTRCCLLVVMCGTVAATVTFVIAATRPSATKPDVEVPRSPCALAASADGKVLYVAEHTARQVAVVDTAHHRVTHTIALPGPPTGLVLGGKGARLYVTCGGPVSSVCEVDTRTRKITATVAVGHTACSPVLAPDGKTLYVCNRFNNNVSVVDVAAKKEVARIAAVREPVAAAITPDGKRLVVANLLPVGRADADDVAAVVTIIDTVKRQPIAQVRLVNGSTSLRGVAIAPDGTHAYVTHVLARFHMPTTQLERGWMNTNALSIIHVPDARLVNTVLLDDVDRGAANPWGVAVSADGKTLCVTHAGTHELSIIDAPALLAKLAKIPQKADPKAKPADDYGTVSRIAADVPNDLSFLVGLRRRIALPGNGPRAVAIVGTRAYVAEYFTDSLCTIDLSATARPVVDRTQLAPKPTMAGVRRGEMLFHSARLCFQGWQSCASCHPAARVDGLNWDLLNDGMGNPKNTRSMLWAHRTPPAMSLGVRTSAEVALRSGIRFIQFAVRPEADAQAIDAYLKSLEPVPSPYRVGGKLSASAQRGKTLFFSPTTGCARCHPAGLYTDLKRHDVGTKGALDRSATFDNPTLAEVWRTAPYLHDGQCTTIQQVLTTGNRKDRHGTTSHLTPQQITDLAAFVLSQ